MLLAALPAWRLARLEMLTDGAAEAAIAANIAASSMTWCGLDEHGGVVNLVGAIPFETSPGDACLWQFIGDVRPCKRGYIRQQRGIRDALLARYERLTVLIETENVAALRHIRRLGFQVGLGTMFGGVAGHLCERTRL
jgi:hypothetical protein